jgi:hypothetical protein
MDLWTIRGCCTIDLPVMACSNPDCGVVVDVQPLRMGFIPKTPCQPNAWFHVQLLKTAANTRLQGLPTTGMAAWVSFGDAFHVALSEALQPRQNITISAFHNCSAQLRLQLHLALIPCFCRMQLCAPR